LKLPILRALFVPFAQYQFVHRWTFWVHQAIFWKPEQGDSSCFSLEDFVPAAEHKNPLGNFIPKSQLADRAWSL
jgi:hypothetical protein